jgi:NarL family two-component system response regulator LiaR
MPITVVLAHDHQILRHGLRSLLEHDGVQVVGEAADGRAALQAVAALGAGTRVVLLTMFADTIYVLAALRAGVRGYVLKRKRPRISAAQSARRRPAGST